MFRVLKGLEGYILCMVLQGLQGFLWCFRMEKPSWSYCSSVGVHAMFRGASIGCSTFSLVRALSLLQTTWNALNAFDIAVIRRRFQ